VSAAKQTATPTTLDDPPLWRVCAGDPTYVSAPGIVQPIKVGSAERAAFIVRACNGWNDVAALRARLAELEGGK
jgi:hypothetical protein